MSLAWSCFEQRGHDAKSLEQDAVHGLAVRSSADMMPNSLEQDAVHEEAMLPAPLVWTPHLALAIAMFCFSGWQILGSLALSSGADPLVFAFYRELFASFLMFLSCYSSPEMRQRGVYKSFRDCVFSSGDGKTFLFIGFCSFINVVGSVFILSLITANRYAVLQPSIPCVAVFISTCLGFEVFSYLKVWA